MNMNRTYTAFLMSIDYFVYLWRQGVAALRPLLRSRSATLCRHGFVLVTSVVVRFGLVYSRGRGSLFLYSVAYGRTGDRGWYSSSYSTLTLFAESYDSLSITYK